MSKKISRVIKCTLSVAVIFLVILVTIISSRTNISNSGNSVTSTETGENITSTTPEIIFDVFSILAEEDFDILFNSEDYKKCINKGIQPTITIDSDFQLSKDIIINEPVNLIFTTKNFNSSNNHRIIINTSKASILTIDSNIPNILEDTLTIEGLSLEIIWNNEVAVSAEDAYKYLNVKSYNGVIASDYPGTLPGGMCNASINEVNYYKNNSKKSIYSGTNINVVGSVITLKIPHEVKSSALPESYLDFIVENGTYEILGTNTDYIPLDFGDNDIFVKLTDDKGNSRNYQLCVERQSYSIPIVEITTEAPVTNKTDYVRGAMTIDGVTYPLNIKGRGNSSWRSFPKKAYRLKLDEKVEILGMEDDKDWVLVSSYADKSLIRNCISTDMANVLDGLEYTPAHKLIDLFYNGEYLGVYTIAEKIEEGKKKVNLSSDNPPETNPDAPQDAQSSMDIGFIIEYGWDFDGENVYGKDYFDTEHTIRLYVKEPDISTPFSPEMKYIMKCMRELDAAIVSGGNYENYIDMDSWVDWFILVELSNNTEVSFYRSCYLYKKEGGKIYLGPIWDYDMAFGNFLGDIQTYDKWSSGEATYQYTKEYTFMKYLINDPKFMSAVKARWNEIKEDLLKAGLDAADKYSSLLSGSQEQNFIRWNIMNSQVGMGASNYRKYNTYELQIQYIKEFLNKRYKWIDNELNTKW